MLQESTFAVVSSGWQMLACQLGSSEEIKEKLRKQLLLETQQLHGALIAILTEWRMKNGSEATLKKLISYLEILGWKNIAGSNFIADS